MLPSRLRSLFRVFALSLSCALAYACGDDAVAEKAGSANETPDAGGAGKAGDSGEGGSSGRAGAGSAGKAGAADNTARAPSAGDPSEPRDAGSAIEQDDMPVTIRFAAKVGEQAFKCGEQYAKQGQSGSSVTPADLRFYVQDLKLVTQDGREVPVQLDERTPFQSTDVALLDFEDASGSCSGDAQTNDRITGRAPRGEYNAIRFSNGVPMALNHSDPKQFPAPLKSPGMSWSWLLGLRFMKLELQTESAPEAEADAGPAAASGGGVHLGSTGCSGNPAAGQISCKKPNRNQVTLSDYRLGQSVIVLDVAKVFSDSDLAQGAQCHAATPPCASMFRSLGVNYASGAAADAQSAYRLQTP